jgi:hypothetical protein
MGIREFAMGIMEKFSNQESIRTYNLGGYIGEVGIGDILISRSGTERKILKILVDKKDPENGVMTFEITKYGTTYTEERGIQYMRDHSSVITRVRRQKDS